MNISPLTIYLWQLADRLSSGISQVIVILMTLGVALLIASAFGGIENQSSSGNIAKDETIASLRTWARRLMVISGILVPAWVATPSSSTIAMMVIIPKLAESKAVQTDLPDLYDLAIKALKEQITPKAPSK